MSTYGGSNIVTNGLILNLDAGNTKSYPGSGTIWYDRSGNNYTGSLVNGPTFSSANGGSIVFDGVDDYATVPNLIRVGLGFSGTIEIVTNCTGSLLSNERTDDSQGNGAFIIPNTQIPYVYVNSQDSSPYTYRMSSSLSGNLNKINHYIVSYTVPTSSGTMTGTFGINGVFENASSFVTVSGIIANFNALDIARLRNSVYGTTYSSPGNIYIVRVYNRRLTQSEMTQNYSAIKSRFNL